ncbi:MAG: error-prone DNA polymerase, partial [Hyphomicrobiales bacterium]|nr:error-prone DNA polymerase [Hyphomicrobiales bacterium]
MSLIPSRDHPAYAELAAMSNFSFLRGTSHPEELAAAAKALGLAALALADRNTLSGIVRAHAAAKEHGLKFIPAARLVFSDDTPDILAYPRDRGSYGRLSRLLTLGNRRAEKGQCRLFRADLLEQGEGLNLALLAPPRWGEASDAALAEIAHAFPGRVWLAASLSYGGRDRVQLDRLAGPARAHRVPLVAVGDVLYHAPQRRVLQDVLTCIREHKTIHEAGRLLKANAERHLKGPAEMARLFRDHRDAVAETLRLAEDCRFSLDELRYEYPDESAGESATPQEELERLTWLGARERYPSGLPDKVRKSLEHELVLIAELDYARYFLTVHDIVRFARARGILCQGRGSAANSAVCFCLGVTEVDPDRIDLLFERFISAERREPPDIDVDFEHERREEVIQYIYGKYGRERAGIAATVISYRTRSAVREVGKAMGLSEDTVSALAGSVWGFSRDRLAEGEVRRLGLEPADPTLAMTLGLTRELTGFPRHLSQHVGGFVITKGRLDEVVPIANAAMEERTFIEWDKDDLDALGMLKIDVLGLGMLTCIRKAFDFIEAHYDERLTLATIPAEDPSVYRMLARADSLGVFQVESRAQMSMLPRLKPKNFYDLVIEVAIVRPGPIQGDMVHPYLRRRSGQENVVYPHPSFERTLKKTLGVPIFQEQVMKLAILAAGYTPGEADQLRRDMAAWRSRGRIEAHHERLVSRMVAEGVPEEFAERIFSQIRGFGEYGFPESHAASFALIAYVTAWLRCHHHAAFVCGLLNSQPMGFYSPSTLVDDARRHGVTIRPIDVNRSEWNCTL